MMGSQLYNIFSLRPIWNCSQSMSPSAGVLPKPFIQAFKPTFTSKKADPNVGHRCIIFKKAILASSAVFPSCLLYAAVMLCSEKKIQSLLSWAQAGFQCPSLALKTASDHHQDQSFAHRNRRLKMKIAYCATGQAESRTSPVFLTSELGEGSPGARGNGFQGREAIWDETKFRKPVFNTHRHVSHFC